MKLTAGQEAAIQAVRDLKKTHPEGGGVGVISGYAGTGKTTLIKILGDEWDDQFVLTPTGKAAVRVREATGLKAKTIHRWQYEPEEDEETGDVTFKHREIGTVEIPSSGVLIIDEASMVGFDVFSDLYSYAKRLQLNIVLIGDGFQLPPVEPEVIKQKFSVFSPDFPANFKVQLTEVLRQALDSPIIRVSMKVRTENFAEDALGELETVVPSQLYPEALTVWENEGATISHRNITRHQINNGIRKIKGFPDVPQLHEPLLVTKNNYALDVYNGEIMPMLLKPFKLNRLPYPVTDRYRNASTFIDYYITEIMTPWGKKNVLIADKEAFGTMGDVSVYASKKAARKLIDTWYGHPDKEDTDGKRPVYLNANLGYALTAHKSQGSEFGNVLVVMEPTIRLNSLEGRRWCYTAITRSKKKLKICWL